MAKCKQFLHFSSIFLLEKYLDCRQRSKYYGGRGKSLPQELAQAKIDEANFKKSLDYGIDKLGFGMFESTFSFCENLLTLLIGLSPLLWNAATHYATSYELVNKDSSSGSVFTAHLLLKKNMASIRRHCQHFLWISSRI